MKNIRKAYLIPDVSMTLVELEKGITADSGIAQPSTTPTVTDEEGVTTGVWDVDSF